MHERLDRLRCAGEAAVIPGEGKHLVPPRRCCGEKRLSMGDAFGVGLDPLLFSERLMRVITTGLGEIGRFQCIDIDLRLASEGGGEGVPRLLRGIAFGDDTEGREPIVHPTTGETIHVADLDGIGQFLKKMYSEEVPEPFRWPKYM